jgi:hypothetical protein
MSLSLLRPQRQKSNVGLAFARPRLSNASMARILAFLLLLLCQFGSGLPARADDSLATIATSGLRFEKSAEISMEYEELYISPERIRVKFEFKNQSDHDIDGTVAFPLPTLDPDQYAIRFVKEDGQTAQNPLGFELKVNGKIRSFEMKTEKTKSGAYEVRYFWKQHFPKGELVTIEHSYKSGAGSASLSPWAHDNYKSNAKEPNPESEMRARYCADSQFLNAVKALFKKALRNSDFSSFIKPTNDMIWDRSFDVEYILKTGANWKGPIKRFELILDKGEKDSLVSLCWSDLNKASPTRFVWEKKDFVPTRDLKILFVSAPK